jgi:penicillin-binding protein 1C
VSCQSSREVLAMVGSAGYGTAPAGAIDFTRASRSPGSTLKPFIFALALQQGRLTPADVMDDLPEGAAGISHADRNFLGPLLPGQALARRGALRPSSGLSILEIIPVATRV